MSNDLEFIVDLENAEKYNLLSKRLVKFDVIDGKVFKMKWTEEALQERKKIQLQKYKQTYENNKEDILLKAKVRYQEKHPEAKKYNIVKEQKLNYYLLKKLKKSLPEVDKQN
jgi:hypothetical protein